MSLNYFFCKALLVDFKSISSLLSDEPVRVQPVRCPSHNAFKCTGECGFDDCNTHFMEQESLRDHISRGRERRVTPSAACSHVSDS